MATTLLRTYPYPSVPIRTVRLRFWRLALHSPQGEGGWPALRTAPPHAICGGKITQPDPTILAVMSTPRSGARAERRLRQYADRFALGGVAR